MNAKKLIISQVKEMLEKNNISDIKAVIIILPVDSENSTIKLENTKGEFKLIENIKIDKKQIMVKMFLSKFAKYCKEKNIEPNIYTIKVLFLEEDMKFYILDKSNKLHFTEL